jgi:hypothetical protein
MKLRTQLLALVVLAGLVAVSSALAGNSDPRRHWNVTPHERRSR